MTAKPPKDPHIEAQIDRTLAKYRGVAPPSMLRAMRRQLRHLLETDANAKAMLDILRNRPIPVRSEDVAKDDAEEDGDASGGEER
jgi:hypothetical protein